MYVRVSKKYRETPLLGASVISTEAKSDCQSNRCIRVLYFDLDSRVSYWAAHLANHSYSPKNHGRGIHASCIRKMASATDPLSPNKLSKPRKLLHYMARWTSKSGGSLERCES